MLAENRKAVVLLCWTLAAYTYFAALSPDLGASREIQQVHAWMGVGALTILGLFFRTDTALSLIQTGDWKLRIPNPPLKLIANVLLVATALLVAFYFLDPDISGRRLGVRLHALTGLFAYNFGRWIYKGSTGGRA